jgi:hypothetical protein
MTRRRSRVESVARFEAFTRLGFAARGITYILIGWLAIEAGRAAGASDALATLADGPGRLLLFLIAAGMFAYGAWKLLEGALDLEGHGADAKGAAVRAGHGVSGVVHLLLGLTALELAMGSGGGSGGDGQTARAATSWLLDMPAGGLLVRAAALALLAAGVYQLVQAVRLRFLKHLEPRAASKAWVKWVGRLGYLARGVVFVLVGLQLWRAGAAENAAAAGGTGEALASLSGTLQLLVAAGLALFGVFSLVQAAYRRISDPHVVDRLKARMA